MANNTFQRLRLIDRIDRSALSGRAAELLRLIERLSRGRWYQATGEYLAACLKASRRSVVRWLAELREAGFLAVWRRSAVVNGVRVAAPSRYRVIAQAVVDAAASGFDDRRAALVQRMRLAVASVKRRLTRPAICANLSQGRDQDRQKDGLRSLWALLGQSREGSDAWLAAVTGLIQAGQGESEADFAGMGSGDAS